MAKNRFLTTIGPFASVFFISGIALVPSSRVFAAEPTPSMFSNVTAFTNCTRGNAELERTTIHKAKMLGADIQALLILSCGVFADSYVYHCQDAGYPEEQCYGDLRLIAEDVLTQIGE